MVRAMVVKRAQPYPLVMVEWEDSARPFGEWRFIEDWQRIEPMTCLSIGWLIADKKRAIALASNFADIGLDSEQVSGVIRIPKSAILSQREIPVRK